MHRTEMLLLAGILLLALLLRVQGLFWDQYTAGHPDERFVAEITAKMGDPNARLETVQIECSSASFWHTNCSPYNPNNLSEARFAYGTFPLFVVNQASVGVVALTGDATWQSERQIVLVGRAVNAMADTLAVLVVFVLASHLLSTKSSLLAAVLYATAVLPLQLAHFWTVDTIANFCFLLLIVVCLRLQKTNHLGYYVAAGGMAALAAASRANLVVATALIPVSAAIYLSAQSSANNMSTKQILRRIMLGGLLAGVVFVATFRFAQPYAFATTTAFDIVDRQNAPPFIDFNWNAQWRADLEAIASLSTQPVDDWPPSYQWYDRTPYITAWVFAVWGMGIGLLLTATTGFIQAIVLQVRRIELSPSVGLLSVWVLLYFAWQGQLHVMTMRYFLPLYGVLIVLAVWGLQSIHWRRLHHMLRAVLLISTVLWALAFTAIYRHPHTRIEAAVWIRDHVPAMLTASNDRTAHPVDVLLGLPDVVASPLVAVQLMADTPAIVNFLPFTVTEATTIAQVSIYRSFDDGEATIHIQLMETSASEEMLVWQSSLMLQDGDNLTSTTQPRTIEAGTYFWRFSIEGDESIQYILPMIMVSSANAVTPSAQTLAIDPASPMVFSLPYYFVSNETPLTIELEKPIQLQTLRLSHQLGEASSLRLVQGNESWLFEQQNTSLTPLPLGARTTYRIIDPIQLAAGRYQLVADSALWIAATAIATEGRWDSPTPTRTCWRDDMGIDLSFIPFDDCDVFNSGFDRGWYAELPLPMVEPDTHDKALHMQAVLRVADYLTISSNRMYDALPRHTARYPWVGAYYEQLFGEALGYRIMQHFTSFPRLGPLVFADQRLPHETRPQWLGRLQAEEAFTVYDHPVIYVLQNVGFDTKRFAEVVAVGD